MTPPNGQVQVVPGRARNGDTVFSVLVKRSYRIRPGQRAERAPQDEPFRLQDSYYEGGDPSWSVVEHESELAPLKAATDVVVIGSAHAPGRQPVQQMVVGVRIGEHKKLLRITGDRRCLWRGQGLAPQFTEPEPFTQLPIRYDLAYGGSDELSDPNLPFHYPRNPLGRGVALSGVREVIEGLALPNIEDPEDLLSPERIVIGEPACWPQQPLPQGLGWRQRNWYPRSALMGAWPPFLSAGTVTPEERLHLLPGNHVALAQQMRLPPFEEQFANGASLGLVIAGLRGDEEVALRGVYAAGALDFLLPADVPRLALDVGEGAQPLKPRLHTVSIEPDALRLNMVWAGSLPFGPATALARLRCLNATVT